MSMRLLNKGFNALKDAAPAYGEIQSNLEKRGLGIGGNDLFIAAMH